MTKTSATCTLSNLSFCVWNVGGLISKIHNKLQDPLFIQTINKYDIIMLTETHLGYDAQVNLSGYKYFPVCRNISKNKRHFGGLGLLIRDKIRPGVKILENKSKDFQWLKLEKNFFNLTKDIMLCLAYIIPANSNFSIHSGGQVLEYIEEDVKHFLSKNNSVVICGDLNARTGSEVDFINNDTKGEFIPVDDNYDCDIYIEPRNSMDRKIDERGKQLLDLCIGTKMRILNGRFLGDTRGKFTCIKPTGNSVVDYVIVSEDLVSKTLYFKVSDFISTLSDCHCMLSFGILATYTSNEIVKTNYESFPGRYKWDKLSAEKFQKALTSEECTKMIDEFLYFQCWG